MSLFSVILPSPSCRLFCVGIMSSHSSVNTGNEGGDRDNLNLPSFRDLVSFRETVEQTNAADVESTVRHRQDIIGVAASPQRHQKDSFENIGLERNPHQINDRQTSHLLPRLDHPVTHTEKGQTERGLAHTNRNYQADLSPSYSIREAPLRDSKLDTRSSIFRDEPAHKAYHNDRAVAYASSQLDASRREGALTSQSIVRPSKGYRAIAPHPSDYVPVRKDFSSTSNIVHNVNDERRSVPPPGVATLDLRVDMRSPNRAQDERRQHAQINRQFDTQRLTEHTWSRGHAAEKSYYQTPTLVREQESSFQKSIASYRQLLHEGRGSHQASSQRLDASPRLPIPHNQGRVFDYSCARLPNKTRLPSPRTSMHPPPPTYRTVQSSTRSMHAIPKAQEQDGGQQRVLSLAPSAYAEEHRMYSALHSLYGSDVRDRPSALNDREKEARLRSQGHDTENFHRAMDQALDRTASRGMAGGHDSPRLRHQSSFHMGPSRRDHEHRPSLGRHEKYVSRPVSATVERERISKQPLSSSDSSISQPTWSAQELPLRPLDRHSETKNAPIQPSRMIQCKSDDQMFYQRRAQAELPVEQQQHRERSSQHVNRGKEYDQHRLASQESTRVEHQQLALALPQQRSMKSAPSVSYRVPASQAGSVIASPGWSTGASGSGRYQGEEDGLEQKRQLVGPRERSQNEVWHRRQDALISGSGNSAHQQRQQTHEDQERFVRPESCYTMAQRANASGLQRTAWQATVDGSGRAPSDRLASAHSTHRSDSLIQRSTRRDDSQLPPATAQPRHMRGTSVEPARPRTCHQSDPFDHVSKYHSHYQSAHCTTAHVASIDPSQLIHRSRALPPVIASQHTAIQHPPAVEGQQQNQQQHAVVAPMSAPPPPRPMKRHRADSDTSLVVKASRFTVVDEGREDELHAPRSSRIVLPSPPHHTGSESQSAESRQHPRTDPSVVISSDVQRVYHSSEKGKSIIGSAPITPPLSST